MISLPQISNETALPIVLALGVFFVGWYLAGNEVMRRRARSLAVWAKRALDPMGGKLAVLWLTHHAFRLEGEGLKAPFHSGSLTGLVESWDVPMIWFRNRLNGRRDMVLFQARLRRQPIWGLELYRPRSLLAGDARRQALEERWKDEPLEEFRLACAEGEAPRRLARQLLATLAAERANLVRLAIRRRDLHVTLALNVPDRTRLDPAGFHRLVEQCARVILSYATPGDAVE